MYPLQKTVDVRVLIIEDEAPAFRRLEKVLLEIDPAIEIVEVLDSVEEAVRWFSEHDQPELVFMDIQISDGLSFQIFDEVEVTSPVVFTTAFDEYLMRAFKVNSIDYLLKPIKREELERALEKHRRLTGSFSGNADLKTLLKQVSRSEKTFRTRFLVKKGEMMLSVKTEDIVCLHLKHGVVHMVTQSARPT